MTLDSTPTHLQQVEWRLSFGSVSIRFSQMSYELNTYFDNHDTVVTYAIER